MLIDLRYHIITIVVLFVSLGIGILIGSTMVGNDLIIKQQQNLINSLEKNLVNLKKQNSSFQTKINQLQTKLANNNKFQKRLLPLLIKGQLIDESLLIVTGDNIMLDLQEKLRNILQLAGITKLKIVVNEFCSKEGYNKVLLLGQVDETIKKKYHQSKQKDKIIVASAKQLKNISGLIKLVFKITSKKLDHLRSVYLE
ncbi:Protein of unknown function (DUF3186) [Halobacteroides halobius DSM 5150]|uniref:Copper transport outer membrane protein, MctB n=1 Tax=Halobacteroides halobius (strain ATCC 35273 / DSM 5150 / MD-1) TaxID=748449 RepID=L0K858_HALHC|nr:copper transporter [Halobacteroides halobius]AGB40544.1 Protein of unknown function (DUF3186) [Halobacteroides halobius DSM 5150]